MHAALSYLVKPLADQIARAMREGIAVGGTYAEYSGASGSIPFTSGFLSMVHSRGIVAACYDCTTNPLSSGTGLGERDQSQDRRVKPKGIPVRPPGSVRAGEALRIRIYLLAGLMA